MEITLFQNYFEDANLLGDKEGKFTWSKVQIIILLSKLQDFSCFPKGIKARQKDWMSVETEGRHK